MAKRRVGSKPEKSVNTKPLSLSKRVNSRRAPEGVRAVPRAAGSPSSAGASGAPASPLPLPVPKSKLKPEELDAFKRLLLEKRVELLEDVGNMEAEALKKNRSDAAGDLSMMPIHMADIGTDAYEQEFTIGLIENEQEIVKEIDAALERMTNGAYGICEATGKRIKKARLKAKPWARYCVAYKRSREETGR